MRLYHDREYCEMRIGFFVIAYSPFRWNDWRNIVNVVSRGASR